MAKNLVIVESPGKVKTISKYLGKDYVVTASFGHIRDLPSNNMGIDIEHNFDPLYEISQDKKSKVAEIKKLIKKDTMIWLATDADREGEAISWHLAAALKLKPEKTQRIIFTEITKSGILDAMKKPGKINADLVDAQQARRILDRLVGYELSPVLWKKIARGLSAGRVQSVAVRMIVDREREILAFKASSAYHIIATFKTPQGAELTAIYQDKLDKLSAQEFLQQAQNAKFNITDINKRQGKKSPSAPLTTSTLQQEAARRLGYSVKATMAIAQKLYEAGKITYMRTDSLTLAGSAIAEAKKYITSTFGAEYSQVRQFKTKSAGAQEAHEAIRPTSMSTPTINGFEPQQIKLYELIYQRTLASQMANAKTNKTTITISAVSNKWQKKLITNGETIDFPGFLASYTTKYSENILPALKLNDDLDLTLMTARETFTRPPARFSEASLVKELEEKGIGRPSTYAPTINTIISRNYIEKTNLEGQKRSLNIITLSTGKITNTTESEITGADKNKLLPTDSGNLVTDFLTEHFSNIVNYNFTANIEAQFDKIALGQSKWQKIIADFYQDFHANVIDKTDNLSRDDVAKTTELGIDPKSKKPVSARLGRFGPYVQIGIKDDEEKPLFASLEKNQRIDTITLTEALALFTLPRELGLVDDLIVLANRGRFGPYLKYGAKFISLKTDNPYKIDLKRATELIAVYKQEQRERHIKTFEHSEIQILKGRYGPYVTDGTKNARIPKDVTDPSKLSLTECTELLKNAKPARGRFKAKTKAKAKVKTTKKKPLAKAKANTKAKTK